MITLTLNQMTFNLNSFSRTTYFDGENISSNGYINVANEGTAVADLHNLAETDITSFVIKKDNTTIYDTGTIDAHFSSIEESLNNEDIYLSANIKFV